MGQEHITTITDLSHDNRGVSKTDGKTVFISNALPGEEVRYKVVKKHRKFDDGVALQILQPSAKRVQPDCKHYELCGGCSAQHMLHEAQIAHKQQLLIQHLQHFGQVTAAELLPPLLGPQWHYRNKARLGVRYVKKKEKVLVGFRETNGRYIADIQQCPVLHPSVGKRIDELAELVERLSCYQDIPQIEVAISDETTALIFRHMKPLTEQDLQCLREFGEQRQFWIYLQPKGPKTIHKLWPEDEQNLLSYELQQYNIRFEFHPSDFTQVNPQLNEMMVHQALSLLDPQANDQVLDLFCGLGNFSLALAKHVETVVGVEGSEEMVQRASHNAAHNHIRNTEFFCANLMEDWTHLPWAKMKYHKLLLDPPRSGTQAIVEQIEHLAPQTITYVSCNPATLARDAGILVNDKGYQLAKAGIMDMFPHTSHVESIALFVR